MGEKKVTIFVIFYNIILIILFASILILLNTYSPNLLTYFKLLILFITLIWAYLFIKDYINVKKANKFAHKAYDCLQKEDWDNCLKFSDETLYLEEDNVYALNLRQLLYLKRKNILNL